MCGIFCQVEGWSRETLRCQTKTQNSFKIGPRKPVESDSKIHQLLSCRGPDDASELSVSTEGYVANLAGHVLWTQGSLLQQQPLVSDDGRYIFCFNGDIYAISESPLPLSRNDTAHLFDLLQQRSISDEDFVQTFSLLEGPFAFILFDVRDARIWFGRDVFGRSNLLLDSSGSNDFCITSVAPFCPQGSVMEIPSAGVFMLDLKIGNLTLSPWSCLERRTAVYECTKQFADFVLTRLHCVLKLLPSVKPSVSCELKALTSNTGSSDAVLKDLKSISKCKLTDEASLLRAQDILENQVSEFLGVLRAAVRKRVEVKPPYCKNCLIERQDSAREDRPCGHSKISVLFSGGLDSTVLAYLVCEVLSDGESVDLVNVAFSPDQNPNFSVPDRITGLASYEALKSAFAHRRIVINFVEVNVLKSEVAEIREKCIVDLISPLQSVLDDSIGCCLWFAARGKGALKNYTGNAAYESPARIIFVGSGADELLGGYSRHRSAYENAGWGGLLKEMQEDIDRISIRNIGRDNRVLSSHGVCPRMPFLDEAVVQYLTQDCDLWVKCCPLFRRGLGEKILLRVAALKLFGKDNVQIALFPKRAMQFGSRIAKLENSKEKGGDVCHRLKANVHTLS